QVNLDSGLGLLVVFRGVGQLEAALASREERGRDLGEVPLHRVERLREAPLDRLRQLCAQLLELLEALLEVLPLRRELLEPRLLRVVLLLRERFHGAERVAPPLEPLGGLGERVAVVALRALVSARVLEPA